MLNSVAVAGRLTAEPVIRYNDRGEAVCRFTIAQDRPQIKGNPSTASGPQNRAPIKPQRSGLYGKEEQPPDKAEVLAKDKTEQKGRIETITDFIDCKAFGKPCEILEKWFKKGDLIIVSGRMQADITEKNGYKSKNVYVKVSEISFG